MFLTGDLGFRALEPLQDAMGERFINAGVAEQNMLSVAAGLASRGLEAWVYSIAPFCYARPFEQIRNDVCLHGLPVKLVGNGGGYAYGVMGASHHAIEDYGVLLTLQHMRIFIPAFASDVEPQIARMGDCPHPAYLRLGRCERPEGFTPPAYAPWRKLLDGSDAVVVAVGPIAGSLVEILSPRPADARPALWVLSELPLDAHPVPAPLRSQLRHSPRVLVVEEHVAQGSAGSMLARQLLHDGVDIRHFDHVCAQGYPSGDYGSQGFHRKESGLDPESLTKRIDLLRGPE